MKFHPLSEAFPLMGDDELTELAADIKAHGLREPVVLYEGMILDGRNRWTACKKARIKQVESVKYEGDDPLGFVVSKNIIRRHLSVSQRAMIAARMATLRDGEHKAGAPNGAPRSASQGEAAETLDVGRRTVQRAKAVQDKGTEAEVAAVDSGAVPVSRAAKEIERKETEIRAAAAADPDRFGDLAERLDKPGAKVEPVHRELRKREKAGTRKKDVLKDALDREVPASLRDLFGDPWIVQTAEAVETFVRDTLKAVAGRVGKRGPRYKFMLVGAILKSLDAAKLELETAHAHLTEARPHAVCLDCPGEKCKACRGAGWLPLWRFTELKKEGQL